MDLFQWHFYNFHCFFSEMKNNGEEKEEMSKTNNEKVLELNNHYVNHREIH